jgi:hypothetical protein
MTAVGAALEAVERERRRCVDELAAFESFGSAVSDLSPAAAAGPVPALGPTSGDGDDVRTVRRAYERTVMSVPHYEDDYGESFAENVAAEFGSDVAAVLTSGMFTPAVRDRLLVAVDNATTERGTLVDSLDREAESLRAGRRRLDGVHSDLRRRDDAPLSSRSFEDLRDLLAFLDDCRARLDAVARERQATLTEHGRRFDWTDASFESYLYDELSVTRPLLSATAERGREVARARRRVVRALTRTA